MLLLSMGTYDFNTTKMSSRFWSAFKARAFLHFANHFAFRAVSEMSNRS